MNFFIYLSLFSCLISGQQQDLTNVKPKDVDGFKYADAGARTQFQQSMVEAHTAMNAGLDKMREYMDLCDVPAADGVADDEMACILVAQMASEVQGIANKGIEAHQHQKNLKFLVDYALSDFSNAFDSATNFATQLADLGFSVNLVTLQVTTPSGVTVEAVDLGNPTTLANLGFSAEGVQLANDAVDSTNSTNRNIASVNKYIDHHENSYGSPSPMTNSKATGISTATANRLSIDFNGTKIGVASANIFEVVSQTYQSKTPYIQTEY